MSLEGDGPRYRHTLRWVRDYIDKRLIELGAALAAAPATDSIVRAQEGVTAAHALFETEMGSISVVVHCLWDRQFWHVAAGEQDHFGQLTYLIRTTISAAKGQAHTSFGETRCTNTLTKISTTVSQ